MKGIRLTCIILLTAIPALSNFDETTVLSQIANTQTSQIIGTVLDANDARIVGAIITIKNANFSRKLRSDDDGSFEVELPPGAYQIIAEQRGFKKFQLSPFRANAGIRELVNIHMEVEPPQSTLKVHP